MSFTIALTGGIASGKTTASDYFAKQGVTIVDTDLIARDVVAPGTSALKDITTHFGQSVLQPDGSLDRAALRAHIFADPMQREWLEALLHPLIRVEANRQLKHAQSPYAIVVIPLLHKDMLPAYPINRVLCIDVNESTQITRLTERDGLDASTAQAILSAQPSRQARLDIADDVIHNESSIEAFLQQLAKQHQHYLTLGAQHA